MAIFGDDTGDTGLLGSIAGIKFKPTPVSMGLLNAGLQMLSHNGYSRDPVSRLSQFGAGGQGFLQGVQAQIENDKALREMALKDQLTAAQIAHYNAQNKYYEAKASGGDVDPYTTIMPGRDGRAYLANHRITDPARALVPITGNDGQPVFLGQFDPTTTANNTYAKSSNGISKYTLPDGREVPMLDGQAAGNRGPIYAPGTFQNQIPFGQGAGQGAGQITPPPGLNQQQQIDWLNANDPKAMPPEEYNRQTMPLPTAPAMPPAPGPIAPTPPLGQTSFDRAYDEKRGTDQAQSVTTAQADLPLTLSNAQHIMQHIDAMLSHPGMSGVVGLPNGLKYIPGTHEADFQARLDQLNGETFLAAYRQLRGAGAITDTEGKKAEIALQRMRESTSESAFREAASEFRTYVEQGLRSAYEKAQGKQFDPASYSTPPNQNNGWSATRVK